MSNFVHQVWSAWIGGSAVVLVLVDWKLQASAPGLLSAACVGVWGNEFLYARHGKILRAGGYGLVLALLGAVSVVAWSSEAWLQEDTPGSVYHLLIGAGLSGAVLLWAVWFLLNREAIHPATSTGRSLLAVASILTVATLKAPGLAPATLILLLGYGNGNRVLLGVGVVALLTYLSFYYYSLEMTLLHKSVLMMGTGLALLTARFLLGQWWPAPSQEKEHYA